MATAGSGDVLTGVISGLLAQGTSPYEAVILSAYLHGLAGAELAKSRSIGILARELADSVGLVLSAAATEMDQSVPHDPWGDILLTRPARPILPTTGGPYEKI